MIDSSPHYENFPVGSLLVPRDIRPAVAAIYRFARYADDVADEGSALPMQRQQELTGLKLALQAGPNAISVPIAQPLALKAQGYALVQALWPHITKHRLGTDCFERLLSAFSQDVVKVRYANLEELLDYCHRSASPVGELMLRLFASASGSELTEKTDLQNSDAICSSLQLINFLQDMAIDWTKQRIYLPLSIAAAHGLTPLSLEQLIAQSTAQNGLAKSAEADKLRAAIIELHQTTQALLKQGRPLIRRVPIRLSLELRAICAGGQRVLDLLRLSNFDPFAARPKLGLKDLPQLVRLFFSPA